jgi:maltooligosyltrehalose trehalohydrolase
MSEWKMTLGANMVEEGVNFAVWAPYHDSARVVISDDHGERTLEMSVDRRGVWSVTDPHANAGSRYAFLPGDEPETPDFYSRRQPDGVHARSEVVDPSSFTWSDQQWRGTPADEAIIYEVHVGTYTPEGNWSALVEQLPELQQLGVTVLEILPVSECPGDRNWGYDGVYHFAPASYYGEPDDMRRFVDAAHQHGFSVILDVVYNHFGPEGNYTSRFSPYYLSDTHTTDWGPALNWDGEHSEMVRQWAIDNICYWINEFHVDGFRLDATHAMVDDSPTHIIQEIAERARAVASSPTSDVDRTLLFYAEDGRHDIRRARSTDRGGEGMDGTWADDFHHEMRVHLTNDHEMWLKYYGGTMVTIAETINCGFGPTTLEKGAEYAVTSSDPGYAFVVCLQNHDQVGNRPFGERLHHVINEDRYKVSSTLLLFSPLTPLLFMGQEFAASTPFSFFTDMPEALGQLVTEGRRREFREFGAFGDETLRDSIPDPQDRLTFERSKLRLHERELHGDMYSLYRDLIAMRKSEAELRGGDRSRSEAAALGAELLSVRRWSDDHQLLLLANFGPETSTLLEDGWTIELTTQDERYGGHGEPMMWASGTATIPARTALILRRER